jgi:uncharacterized protein (TIGR00645 family)
MQALEKLIETILFKSRWLLTPLYVGLVLALFLLVIKFVQKFAYLLVNTLGMSGNELILSILSLVDIVLVANLLLMIIFSGYENFVSKIDMVEGHVDKPDWMGKVGYSDLKLKVIGSVVAISSIELLRAFMTIESLNKESLLWMVVVHMAFVVSGVLFALMEKLAHKDHHRNDDDEDDAHSASTRHQGA